MRLMRPGGEKEIREEKRRTALVRVLSLVNLLAATKHAQGSSISQVLPAAPKMQNSFLHKLGWEAQKHKSH